MPTRKSPEKKSSVEEETFQRYFYDLNLKPEDFDKVILDVGAGSANFAKWAKEHDLSSQIYSLEPYSETSFKEKVLIAEAQDIPMPDNFFDLIVSNAAIPNIYLGEYDAKEKIKKSFSEMLRVLKDEGEIRLARVLIGRIYQRQLVLADSIKESLSELQEKYNFEIKKIRTPQNDTYEYDENHNKKNLLAESYLFILKKRINNNLVQ